LAFSVFINNRLFKEHWVGTLQPITIHKYLNAICQKNILHPEFEYTQVY